MSEKQSKSPEELKAQVAAFAHEEIEDYRDRADLLARVDDISAGQFENITRNTESVEYHNDESGNSVRTPIGTERTVATKQEYIDFLRRVGGSKSDIIRNRTDMITAYGLFESHVDSLIKDIEGAEDTREHSSFLGNGSNSRVFSMDFSGRKYAVRKIRSAEAVNSHLAGAVLGKGISHLEQIIAASFEKGVTIAEIMPGSQFGNLSLEEIRQINDGQLEELLDTIIIANKRGIKFDQKPSNYLYDSKLGFGIVDMTSGEQDIASAIHVSFTNMGIYGRWGSCKTVEEYAKQLEFHQANIDVLKRYRAVVSKKLDGAVLETALIGINRDIDAVQNSIDEYSDPLWVAEQTKNKNKEE